MRHGSPVGPVVKSRMTRTPTAPVAAQARLIGNDFPTSQLLWIQHGQAGNDTLQATRDAPSCSRESMSSRAVRS